MDKQLTVEQRDEIFAWINGMNIQRRLTPANLYTFLNSITENEPKLEPRVCECGRRLFFDLDQDLFFCGNPDCKKQGYVSIIEDEPIYTADDVLCIRLEADRAIMRNYEMGYERRKIEENQIALQRIKEYERENRRHAVGNRGAISHIKHWLEGRE